MQCVLADIGAHFGPLEQMTRTHFLMSLIGIPSCEIDRAYRELFSHSVKKGGLVVRNPSETVEMALVTSKAMT